MAFWGIEVKPGKPYNHNFDKTRGRLHVSQATLGIGSAEQRSVVQCNVGDKSPILLCSLLPDKIESCNLDLEFEEVDEVIFSVLGPRSVHLTGFYLGQGQGCCDDGDDDTDSYGEDIGESESGSEEFDTEEEEYEDDFINDDEEEDDELEMFSSPRPNSGVVIEEIEDDEKPTNGNGNRKRLKKKYEISDSDGDDKKQMVVKGGNNFRVMESEDEDGFPISSQPESITTTKNNEGKSDKKIAKEKKKKKAAEEKSEKKIQTESKKEEDGVDNGAGNKRKIDNITQDGEAERASEKSEDSSKPSTEIGQEKSEKPKKKKKVRTEGRSEGVGDDSKDVQKVENTQPEAKTKDEPKDKQPNDKSMEIDADHATDEEHSAKKKKKKKKNKSKESETNAVDEAKKGSVVESEDKVDEAKSSKMRTFSNGLVIEDVEMGQPDGKKASAGSKVSVRYIGKLKSNGKIFDSNIRGPPFKFRLGVGQVIKGWDVGVSGMRIGDKRRLTIPPAMGYGPKGAGKEIPPNAWLVFDVELVEVR